MRGVVALAAAIGLPVTLADGSEFPQRNLIVFLTFSVIFVTLVLQGLTLPSLVRFLGLATTPGNTAEEEEARRIITRVRACASRRSPRQDLPDFAEVYDDLARHYRQRFITLAKLNNLQKESVDSADTTVKLLDRHRVVAGDLIRIERKTAVRLRNEGRIGDEVLRKIQHELDLSEMRLELS